VLPSGEFLIFVVASTLVTLAPGPDNLYVLSTGLTQGRRVALAAGWGMCSGISIHTLAAATGIAGLIYAFPPAYDALLIVGVGYLLWLAWVTWSEQSVLLRGGNDQSKGRGDGLSSMYLRGFLMNVINPKVGLFFLSFLPQFAGLGKEGAVGRLFLLGGVFMLQAFFWFGVIAWFSGSLGLWLRKYVFLRAWLAWGSIAVYLLLALRLALS
jgi:threonine/homoserine/homoserine lactone efflux protein